MRVSRFAFRVSRNAAVAFLLVAGMAAQEPTAAVQQVSSPTAQPAKAAVPALSSDALKQIVAREFGASFELLDIAPLFLDMDGDGSEDAVLIATSKNPLVDATELRYKVVDPYDEYFGFGDPKITAGFSPTQIGPPRFLLVLHGWRETAPKAKYVIINLPFDKLSAGRTLRKKKAVAAIVAEEAGGLTSNVYWDGKKYKWEPNYFAQ
jgi:hypothetical protein